jgi:Outer membrane protein and related peptidoglycan-associated (lipo)proteins
MLLVVAAGCKKKPATPPPAPPPAPAPAPPPPAAARIQSFTAEPSTIERGQSSTLRWSVENATTVTIEPGIGTVPASGSRQVFPTNTTTYTLRAQGPGGSANATATVTVTTPPPPPPKAEAPKKSISERLASEVSDVYFDYDRSDIREDARATLARNADALRSIFQDFPQAVINIEGHCDERGSAEYNLGLGDRRAAATKDFLVQLGVPGDRLRTISYGKERPQCTESNEGCWQRNRRAHFSVNE